MSPTSGTWQRASRLIGRWRGSFSFRTGLVLSGSVLGQAVAMLLLPFIARRYGTETIGQAGVTLAALGILSLIACWQYDQAVVVAQDADLRYLLLLSILLAGGLTAFLAAVLFVLSRAAPQSLLVLKGYGIDDNLVILLLPYALFLLLVNLQLRNNRLLHVSVARFIYYGGTAILQILATFVWSATSQAFLLSQTFAACLAILPLFPYGTLRGGWHRLRGMNVTATARRMAVIARTYRDFPRYQAGAQVLNAFSLNLPVLVLNTAFSATWAGWYFMANRLVAAPVVLLSQAIGQVFYRDSAERERVGAGQAQFLERIATTLVKVGLFFGVMMGTTAPFWVPIVLGEAWIPVATILQILLLVFVVTFFTSPITSLLNVKGRQKGTLGYYSLLTLTRTAAVFGAWWLRSEWVLIWAYAIASLFVMAPLFQYIVHSAGGSVQRIVHNARHLLIALAGVVLIAASFSLAGWLTRWPGALAVFSLLLMVGLLELRRVGIWRALTARR